MDDATLNKLASQLSRPGLVIRDLTGFEKYCQDATEESGEPLGLIFAETEADVIAVMSLASRCGIAIVPRGTGTGLSGGCVPSPGSLVLSLERMTEIKLDPERRLAKCGPGVITADLLKAAARFDLTYPPDPASFEECTLGGNVAENAGGLRCKRFGVTRDFVIGLRAVTADGGLLTTGVYNDNEAFGIGDVLIGSEGTLAVITEIALRLIPTPPTGSTILVAFDQAEGAAQAVSDITAAGVIPNVMEYLDGDAAACSNDYEPVAGLEDVAAILLFETAGERDAEQTSEILRICGKNRCSLSRQAKSKDEADELWRIRRNLSKAVRAAARFRFNEDIAVPVSRFTTMIAWVSRMNADSPIRINAFGHAGDGNLHVSFLSATGDDAERALIARLVEDLYRQTIKLGGTLTGEHGIGLHKGKYLPLEFDPPTLRAMQRFKNLFDPDRILNPGKLFDD
jgi:glycolate oxidase subunit GlcD